MASKTYQKFLVPGLFLVGLFALAAYFTPQFLPKKTITVTGEAKREEVSQIANFYVSVTANGNNKDTVVEEVNDKANEIVDAVKDFGIPEADIKTENVSVYGNDSGGAEILIFPPRPRSGWTASNSITVTLRDVSRVADLAELLNSLPANSINGPNFDLDETAEAEAELLERALENARAKAEKIARSSGQRLGKIINLTEDASGPIVFPLDRSVNVDSSAPVPVEPGTQTLYKSVTVTFELR